MGVVVPAPQRFEGATSLDLHASGVVARPSGQIGQQLKGQRKIGGQRRHAQGGSVRSHRDVDLDGPSLGGLGELGRAARPGPRDRQGSFEHLHHAGLARGGVAGPHPHDEGQVDQGQLVVRGEEGLGAPGLGDVLLRPGRLEHQPLEREPTRILGQGGGGRGGRGLEARALAGFDPGPGRARRDEHPDAQGGAPHRLTGTRVATTRFSAVR